MGFFPCLSFQLKRDKLPVFNFQLLVLTLCSQTFKGYLQTFPNSFILCLKHKEILLGAVLDCQHLTNWSDTIFFQCIYLFIFRGRGKERRKRETQTSMWERNTDWLLLVCSLTGDWTHNQGICSDWESNQWPFSLRDDTQPTEPDQSEMIRYYLNIRLKVQSIRRFIYYTKLCQSELFF